MNFELTPQQKAVQQSARQFAQTVLQETVLEDDAAGRFPEEAYKKMGEMGFVGLPFPKEYGCQGGDYLSFVLALEEISMIYSSVGIAYSVCTSLYSVALINDGNEEQKKKYIPDLASGKKLGAFGLTEPGAGTDAQGQQTKAVLDGDEWVLNGSKCFITNGKEADVYIIIAVTGTIEKRGRKQKEISAFIVEKGTPGFTFGTKENKMGICGSSTYELIFTDCRIPKDALLGQKGKGYGIAMHTLEGGRIRIAAQAHAINKGALVITLD